MAVRREDALSRATGAPRAGAAGSLPRLSYFEVEVSSGRLNIFERAGDGKTEDLLRALSRFGLKLEERVSSPCG